MKKRIILFLTVALCMLMGGCGADNEEQAMNVYYLNADNNALIQEKYPMMSIEGTLNKLQMHGVLNDTVKIEKYQLNSTNINLFFDKDYFTLDKSTEVLTRAAIVQTITQVQQIDFVTFYVDGEELTDKNGHVVGMMSGEDFVQNTGSSMESYQTTDLTLYFADKEGMALKETKVSDVRYNANTSIERLVIQQLAKGTERSGVQPTVPDSITLLGVSVKENICYVNFDSKFVSESYDLNPEVTIYSIVNSLIANGNITEVQILVDGESDEPYKDTVDLSRPLLWNEKLIKE